MKKAIGKSHCPINFSLEIFGDSWSLLIIRDIVFGGKRTFGEFLNSEENIATNILATRLLRLENEGILIKTPFPKDKRKEIYTLTKKGLDLIPLLIEISLWGFRHDKESIASKKFMQKLLTNREEMIKLLRETTKQGETVL